MLKLAAAPDHTPLNQGEGKPCSGMSGKKPESAKQLTAAALIPAERAELLAQKEVLEAELKAAKAKKFAASAAAGAYGL